MPNDFRRYVSTRPADALEVIEHGARGVPMARFEHQASRGMSQVYIFGGMLDRALGEFINKSMFAAAVKHQFDDAFLTLYFHDDRSYKRDILDLNPHINKSLMAGGGKTTLPLEYFYGYGDREPIPAAEQFIKLGLAFPDLILTPSMIYPQDVMRFDYIPYFQIPPHRRDELDQELIDLGIDPERWICCVYHREPGYKPAKMLAHRNVAARPFNDLCHWVIRELGGQVVRIGHPGMTSFGDMPGFIDLAQLKDRFMLQACAVARSRFGVITNSGPASLFGALGTPHVITNATCFSTAWRQTDYTLPRHFRAPNGGFLDISAAIQGGYWNDRAMMAAVEESGYQPVDNSQAELRAATTRLFEETIDTPGWRPHRDAVADAARHADRPNTHITNGPFRHSARLLRFPELAPVPDC